MNNVALFTDVSLNPKSKCGVGAYLILPVSVLDSPPHRIERSRIADRLVMRTFESTSSTKLEVQTVLWALEVYRNEYMLSRTVKLRVFSDSQCVAGLLKRRPLLETTGFIGRSTHRLLKNAALYRTFYEFHDELGFEVIKVAGHSPSDSHDTIHRIFSYVDKEVRKALYRLRGERELKHAD
jgi:ribonuclease HI